MDAVLDALSARVGKVDSQNGPSLLLSLYYY